MEKPEIAALAALAKSVDDLKAGLQATVGRQAALLAIVDALIEAHPNPAQAWAAFDQARAFHEGPVQHDAAYLDGFERVVARLRRLHGRSG